MKLAQKLTISYLRAKLNILAMVSKRKAAEKALDLFSTPFRKPRHKHVPIFDKAEKLSFELEKNIIRGYRWNYPRDKKVLIVHGFESNCHNFDRYISPLLKKGYEVLAFDAPAHGKSGGKRIILPMYISALKKIAELYGPAQGFLAHSFGGLAVAHYLEMVPHDENTRVVLIAPATETTSAIDSFFKFMDLGIDFRKEFDQLIFDKGGVWPDYYSVRRAVKNIKGQVLWFHDEQDDMTPLSDALKVKDDGHAHIKFVVTQGLGHRRIYRENKVVKQAIDFL